MEKLHAAMFGKHSQYEEPKVVHALGLFTNFYDLSAETVGEVEVQPNGGYDKLMKALKPFAAMLRSDKNENDSLQPEDAKKQESLVLYYFHQSETRRQNRAVRCLITGDSTNLPHLLSDPDIMLCLAPMPKK
jgi:hypothetical protein